MNEHKRPTSKTPQLVSIRVNPPKNGDKLLALSKGGRLLETVWGQNSHHTFIATMPYPDLSDDLKHELYLAYLSPPTVTPHIS